MARKLVASSSQYLESDWATISAPPFSMAIWWRPANTSTQSESFSIQDKDEPDKYVALGSRSDGSTFRARFRYVTNYVWGGALSADQWAHVAVSVGSLNLNSANLYTNGNKATGSSAELFSANYDRIAIGALRDSTPSNYSDGDVAEAAVWSVVLTDDEMGALAAGVRPIHVRPDALLFYAPLWREEDEDYVGGVSLTAGGSPTVATGHPPIIWQVPAWVVPFGEAGGGGETQTIALNAISSTSEVYQPAVTPGAVTISLNAIESTSTVYQPVVTAGAVTVALNTIDSTSQVFEPAVTVGAVTIALDTIDSASEVYQPAITTGSVTIALDTIPSTSEVYQPALSIGPVTIALETIVSTAQVFDIAVTVGAVTIELNTIESTSQVFEPAIVTGTIIELNTIASTSEVFQPAITVGAVTIALDTIASTAQVFQPAVGVGASLIELDTIASTSEVYQPAVSIGPVTIALNTIDSTAQVFEPAVTVGAVAIALNAIASTAQVFPPFVGTGVEQGIALGFIPSTAQVFTLVLSAISADRTYRIVSELRTATIAGADRIYVVTGE